jgi:hypothetical protein
MSRRPSDRDDEARFADVILVPSAVELRRRLPASLAGIVSIGIGIGLSVRAELGLAPWDVFHQGLADATGISIGIVVVLVGLVVLLTWVPLRQQPGVGTGRHRDVCQFNPTWCGRTDKRRR